MSVAIPPPPNTT